MSPEYITVSLHMEAVCIMIQPEFSCSCSFVVYVLYTCCFHWLWLSVYRMLKRRKVLFLPSYAKKWLLFLWRGGSQGFKMTKWTFFFFFSIWKIIQTYGLYSKGHDNECSSPDKMMHPNHNQQSSSMDVMSTAFEIIVCHFIIYW